MTLSKSDYMLFLRHPAWLWLKKYDKAKLPVTDDNLQAVFDAGHAFENYAEKLFPSGLKLGFSNFNEYSSLTTRTTEAIKNNTKTIFQARFEAENLTCICDIIVMADPTTIDLYEIKSSTKAKEEHEFDLSFQEVVLEKSGFTVRTISVVHINNEYLRKGDIDPNQLVTITNITDITKARHTSTLQHISRAQKMLTTKTIPDISPSHCRLGSLQDWLGIYKTLTPVESGSIYDLCLLSAEIIGRLEKLGITKLTDIPDDFELSDKQQLQVRVTKQGSPLINQDYLQDFISRLVFPLYFFDYETLSSSVPYFDGLRSYQQLPSQFSLHILHQDGTLIHHDYLHQDHTNPSQPLTDSLKSVIGTSGSIITWNESFEKTCNNLLGNLLPQEAKFYQDFNARVVDLMLPFSKGHYAHPGFLGSASIKKVLPVLVPELSYKDLDINEGASAQRLWMEAVLDGKHDPEKAKIMADLLKYCELDTLAMVKIYAHMVKIVSK